MVARGKGTCRFLRSQDSANGHAAAQGLGSRQNIGFNAIMFIGEQLPGAAHAGLHFVDDHEYTKLVAERPYLVDIFGREGQHAAFALDQLEHNGAGFLVGCLAQRLYIAGLNIDKAGRQWGIGFLILCLRCGGNHG